MVRIVRADIRGGEEHVFVHPPEVVAAALHLVAEGETSRAVSRQLGVPARTVRDWHQGRVPRSEPTFDRDRLCSPSYAYLLGLYLGDGWIARVGRTLSLRVALDDRYPGIIASAAAAMSATHPRGMVHVASREGCSVVSSYWNAWPRALPQHGSGRKHRRLIQLTDWQRAITTCFPRELVRGLIHSDGCRFVANQRVGSKTYSYPRYSFSNRSEDIQAIFCEHLDLLTVRWTRPNAWSIAIDRRGEVAKLDAFVGPKR